MRRRHPHPCPAPQGGGAASSLQYRLERSPHRRYDDACATAHALELIGERGALIAKRGAPAHADVTIESTPETVAALIYDNAPLTKLERTGPLKITGARAAFTRFANVFERPAKAGG